ncbi:hypothetical protein [Microcoleus sp. OTE_8_concoct_300]|uniref:hypothetical protein n=1 Tax=Microcoleus sp. OTE_8_concoct_300 TaxID=2964710 RepID=UPI00403FBF36
MKANMYVGAKHSGSKYELLTNKSIYPQASLLLSLRYTPFKLHASALPLCFNTGEWLILSICLCGGSRNWLFRTGIIFPGFLCSGDWWSFTYIIGALQLKQDKRLQEEIFL